MADAAGAGQAPAGRDQDELVEWINETCPRLRFVGPISKRLACGDVGIGAMAEVPTIRDAVNACLS